MQNICLSCTKNGAFSHLLAVKKDTILGAAQTKFGPSYFVRALFFFYLEMLKCMFLISKDP